MRPNADLRDGLFLKCIGILPLPFLFNPFFSPVPLQQVEEVETRNQKLESENTTLEETLATVRNDCEEAKAEKSNLAEENDRLKVDIASLRSSAEDEDKSSLRLWVQEKQPVRLH